ncbi:hypothetical protein [Sodalinema gerasimenkoae]|uniref:hypothetical protein n=1 Tax=Sodalinema gerasimenkoae TaxID=2862348 RepID=UPI00135C58CF|nr:hypothetical protein [Sodalinema gerasimenkoae]
MSIFEKISGAFNDPNLQANVGQVTSIVSTLQQSGSSQGLNANTSQVLLSLVGKQVQSSLKSKCDKEGTGTVQTLIEQFGGNNPNLQAVQALLSPKQQEEVVSEASQKTGVNASQIQALLPVLVPLVLNLLKSGNSCKDAKSGNNPVLMDFLSGDGGMNVSNAISLAGQFLNR